MKTTTNFIFVLMLVILIGCDKNEQSITIDTVPMTVGSKWTYKSEDIILGYDSANYNKIVSTDTIKSIITVSIDKDTTFSDGRIAKVFKTMRKYDYSTSIMTDYKFIDNEGLKIYGYDYKGNYVKEALKINRLHHFNLSNRIQKRIEGSFIREDVPPLDIKLPLLVDSKWSYRLPSGSNNFHIDKEVLGSDNVTIAGRTFSCLKISTLHIEPTFPGITQLDWISKEGLIKQESTSNGDLTDENGNPIGYIQTKTCITLTEISIK